MRFLRSASEVKVQELWHCLLLLRTPSARPLESAQNLLLRLPGDEEAHCVPTEEEPQAPFLSADTLNFLPSGWWSSAPWWRKGKIKLGRYTVREKTF